MQKSGGGSKKEMKLMKINILFRIFVKNVQKVLMISW